jgi:divalent metal cation (Fe/Co/Zn/Cd) transporter
MNYVTLFYEWPPGVAHSSNSIAPYDLVLPILRIQMDARMGLPSVAMVISIICAKSALYWLCARRHSTNSDVLAVDQRNDVFSNLMALVGALIGTHLWPYADPLGAITIW